MRVFCVWIIGSFKPMFVPYRSNALKHKIIHVIDRNRQSGVQQMQLTVTYVHVTTKQILQRTDLTRKINSSYCRVQRHATRVVQVHIHNV